MNVDLKATVEACVQKLEMQDGDILVVQFLTNPTIQQCNHVQASFREMFKRLDLKVEICMLGNNMALSIIRPQGSEPAILQ